MATSPSRPPFRLEPLASHHAVDGFNSGGAAIDSYLRTSAVVEQTMGLNSVTIAIDPKADGAIVAFFTLSPLSIRLDPRVLGALGLASVPYPSVGGYLLGRLGVDQQYQRQGIGQALVVLAVRHARRGREGTGGVFLAVDAKDDDLVGWYERLGFARLGSHTRRCVMRL
jgi:ribosomal protein S18 acetylase RimI-like enzyme